MFLHSTNINLYCDVQFAMWKLWKMWGKNKNQKNKAMVKTATVVLLIFCLLENEKTLQRNNQPAR